MSRTKSEIFMEFLITPLFLYCLLFISWLWLIEPETRFRTIHVYLIIFAIVLHSTYKIGYKHYLLNLKFRYFIFVFGIPVLGAALGVIGAYINHYS